MENTMTPCPTCGKLDQPHNPCNCPNDRIRVGSVVVHKDEPFFATGMFRGPGTVTKLHNDSGVDFATVLWQSSLVEWDHRVERLAYVGQMIQKKAE